jgi:hypothetical protein
MSISGNCRGLLRVRTGAARAAGVVAAAWMLTSCGGAASGGGAAPVAPGAAADGHACAPGPASAGGLPAGVPEAPQPGSSVIGGQLNAVAAVSSASAWAAGYTALVNPLTMRWDGRTWTPVLTPIGDHLASPSGGYFNGVAAVSAREAWAVGSGAYDKALVEHWDGTAWSPVPAPDPQGGGSRTEFQGVAAASADDAWAVGGNDSAAPVIIHWNGTAWTLAPSPAPAGITSTLEGVAAISAADAWAVGETYTRTSASGVIPLIEHWNGTAWTLVPSPAPPGGGDLYSVAVISAADAWAVGASGSGGGLIEHWNGRAWALAPSPDLGRYGQLRGAAALSPDSAWAVGSAACPGQGLLTVTEHWNGRAWALVPSPAAGMLTGVAALSPDSAWAVGFWTATGTAIIEHWNGTAWTWPAGFCASPSGPGCYQPNGGTPSPAAS